MCSSYRFQQFMNLHRGNGDMLRWITRFQLSVQRMQEAWKDTYLPITDPMNAEVRALIAGLPAEEQGTITNDEAMERANERLRDKHARTIPITANLVALIFVSLSDLTQDQRSRWQAGLLAREPESLWVGKGFGSGRFYSTIVLCTSACLSTRRVGGFWFVFMELRGIHDEDGFAGSVACESFAYHPEVEQVVCAERAPEWLLVGVAPFGDEMRVDFFDRDLVYNPLLAPSGHGGRKTFLVIEEGYLDNQEGFWVEDEEDGAEGFLEADEAMECCRAVSQRHTVDICSRGKCGLRHGRFCWLRNAVELRAHLGDDVIPELGDTCKGPHTMFARGHACECVVFETKVLNGFKRHLHEWHWQAECNQAVLGSALRPVFPRQSLAKDANRLLAPESAQRVLSHAPAEWGTRRASLDFHRSHEGKLLVVSEAFPRKENEARIQRPAKRQRKRPKRIRRKTLLQEENLADNNTEAWQAEGQWHDESWQESSWDDWSWDYAEESYAAKGKGKKGKKGKGKGKYGKDGKDGKGGSKDGAANLADSAQGSAAIAATTTFYTEHLNLNDFWAMTSRVAAQYLMKNKCKQKLIICMYDREFAVQSTEFDIVEQGTRGTRESRLCKFATDDEWVVDENKMELIRVHKKMRQSKYDPKNGHTPIPLEFLDTQRKTIMEFSKEKIVTQEDDWGSTERGSTKTPEYWRGSPEDIVSKGKPEDSSKDWEIAGGFPLGKAAPPSISEDDPDLHEYAPSEPGEPLSEEDRASVAGTRGVKGLSSVQAYAGKTERRG
ncbi:hypothetical protein AK812_SmicGene35404 [Symbiodinium microadriaticum]|uniref:Uncharacterized protein n=1 Tax=Symbiodinium microadriaticum TaxID=2951 RepID=A0A1Q9CLK9_SYMMI|nr:hypothetical protein AK812_SmicGene35404 [Symbiodinium microadriaticum]